MVKTIFKGSLFSKKFSVYGTTIVSLTLFTIVFLLCLLRVVMGMYNCKQIFDKLAQITMSYFYVICGTCF